ncbi:S1 family peptidase [Klebsiella pneumoniae]|uniref:S1 family peptidase n=1 Tax=Klebsiella pneumoniae TaxID=573 RepID=UPI0010354637|nr:serine protease [Klebsiella pneumoniae]
MKISQTIAKSTVRIECDVANGVSVGTGFFFGFQIDEKLQLPLLVTNKHVIKGATSIRMRFNINNSNNPQMKVLEVQVKSESDFIHHPDPNIDICAIALGHFLTNLLSQGIEVDRFTFTDKNFTDGNFITSAEDVFMTGYPNGLWDMVNNRPITRKGIAASSPLEDWQGRPEFMIDMACYGGSSGSPVYIMNEGGFSVDGGFAVGHRLILLGILYAGPTIDVGGSISIVNVPTAANAVVTTKLMMNLGVVIKAEQLNGLRPLLNI